MAVEKDEGGQGQKRKIRRQCMWSGGGRGAVHLLELEGINGQRHVLLIGAAFGLERWVRTVHDGSQDSGHCGNIGRLVLG